MLSASCDISVVLVAHREAAFLRRCLMSLEEAAAFALHSGLTTELIVVLDRADAETLVWFETFESPVLKIMAPVRGSFGSFAEASLAGAAHATGHSINFLKAGDLLSFNCLEAMARAASEAGQGTLWVPQFVYRFGTPPHRLLRLYSDRAAGPKRAFEVDLFPSQIFCHRVDLDHLCADDMCSEPFDKPRNGDLVLAALAAGFAIRPVRDTIQFERATIQPDFHAAILDTRRTSAFFQPDVFLKLTENTNPLAPPQSDDVLSDFMKNTLCQKLLLAAAHIDPVISPAKARSLSVATNLDRGMHAGAAYAKLCRVSGRGPFSDILLVPALVHGGADRYILNVLSALYRADPRRTCLVVANGAGRAPAGLDRLPPGSVYFDLDTLENDLSADEKSLLLFRLIQSVGPRARLHFKAFEFARHFIARHGARLSGNQRIYYRFCDSWSKIGEEWVAAGLDTALIGDYGASLDTLITDCDYIRTFDAARLDLSAPKYHTLHAPVALGTPRPETAPFARRLVWASRLDRQKRPDLLLQIAQRLAVLEPGLAIDVYGSAVINDFDVRTFRKVPNIRWCGAFEQPAQVFDKPCDGLLYTSAFDGLPNIILEAMAHGVPVIAPNLGGIPEVVTEHTGYLVRNSIADTALVEGYGQAVRDLYADVDLWRARSLAARAFVASQHSEAQFESGVKQLFGNSDG